MPRNEKDEGTVGSLSRWIQADAHGKFSVSLQPGRYKIAGKAEADGYPNPVFAMCGDPKADFPTVSVGQSAVSGVRVKLGAKGGSLEGSVHDKATRLPIQKAKVRISDARDTSAYVEIFTNSDGSFHFTVPSKAVVIYATAAGYNQTQINGGQSLRFQEMSIAQYLLNSAASRAGMWASLSIFGSAFVLFTVRASSQLRVDATSFIRKGKLSEVGCEKARTSRE